MNRERLKNLQKRIVAPLLIKKKENLFYLLGRSPMDGWLFVDEKQTRFFGSGLEKLEGVHTDILKHIGVLLKGYRKVQVEDSFTFAEASYLRSKVKDLKLEPVKSPVDAMRELKDKAELGLIRTNGTIVEKVWRQVRSELRQKVWTEIELARRIIELGKRAGAEGVSFDPIVASGPNAAVPHHRPGKRKLRANESIVIDFGFKYHGYCSDFTRTVFLKKAPTRLANIYEQVEKAYWGTIGFVNHNSSLPPLTGSASSPQALRGEAAARPPLRVSGVRGVIKACEVYEKTVEIIAKKKLDKYFIHNLGHGCGLEIHEAPYLAPASKDVLRDDMVFSIEPGVYLPNVGGVRIEDLVYLGKGLLRRLTRASTRLAENII